jgi:1,4-alpha-glucan branching enzyme
VVCNFTPTPKWPYRLAVPSEGVWKEVLNSDAKEYGGTGDHMNNKHQAIEGEWAGRSHYIEISMAPLAIMIFEKEK